MKNKKYTPKQKKFYSAVVYLTVFMMFFIYSLLSLHWIDSAYNLDIVNKISNIKFYETNYMGDILNSDYLYTRGLTINFISILIMTLSFLILFVDNLISEKL